MKHSTPQRRGASRKAEKEHVQRLPETEWLAAKPFLAGTGLDVDRALLEIEIFTSLVQCLPCGPGSLILDLGAGPCWISEWLQLLRYRTCSLDLAEDMLRIGRRRLAPGSWLATGDVAALPFRDGAFDGALCCGALHHVPEWRWALREIHRVLRPGGVLVLQEPGRGHHRQAESISQMAQFGVLEQELPAGHLARACRQAGFDRALVRPVGRPDPTRMLVLPPYPFWRQAPRLFVRRRLRGGLVRGVERILNRLTGLHIVVAIRGRPWADSRRPELMVVRFVDLACPRAVRSGEPARFVARVMNTGLTRWQRQTDAAGLGRVQLGVSLLDGQGRLQQLDFARYPLPRDVEPGEGVEITGALPPLLHLGRVGLQFDLVAEGICWFGARGSRPRQVHVEVQPPR